MTEPNHETTAVHREIAETWARYCDAFERSDAGAIAAHFTEDAVLMEPNRPDIRGRAGIGKYIEEIFARARVTCVENWTHDLWVHGDVAYEIGTSEETIRFEGAEPMDFPARYMVAWRREPDGSWLMHRLMVNSLRPKKS
jgi:uncharacterized protein (TIGR02246 family)